MECDIVVGAALLRSLGTKSLRGSKKILTLSQGLKQSQLKEGNLSNGNYKSLVVVYKAHSLTGFSEQFRRRDFLRYDFLNEWNNRGYGPIDVDGGAINFSCTQAVELGSGWVVLAEIQDGNGKKISDYAGVRELDEGIELWFNRPVGPVDGYDWIVVEKFFASYLTKKWGGLPVILEVPFRYDGAVTMRIDCDEAVASGRHLFELYKKYDMPFSMAIKTQQDLGVADIELMKEVISHQGAIVGHSHTHAPNWGGSAASAQWEVEESHKVLRGLGVEGINYDYVVSPFHQNSKEAIEGLRNAGIKSFVSGIICNDPEFLMARAGQVPGVEGILSHSQQCMFHGDVYHKDGNSIEGYKAAWQQAYETKTFFGYLDHPFSNYWYGWESEEERLFAHEEFLKFLQGYEGVWRASLSEALRFLEMKSTVQVEKENGFFKILLPYSERYQNLPSVAVVYGDKTYELKLGETLAISE